MAGPPHGPYRGLTDEEKANAPKLTKALAKRIFSYLGPYKLKFAIVIVVVLLSAALGVVPSLLTGRMVDDGLIAGAALDVYVKEPLPMDSPLMHLKDMSKIRFSPHIAWSSREARQRLAEAMADNIKLGW